MNRIIQSSTCLRRLIFDYRIILTEKRFRSKQQRVKKPRISPYLSPGVKTIREIKQPSDRYWDTKLSDADIELIGRNNFLGVKSLSEKGYKKRTPENTFGLIAEQMKNNKRVNAEFFMVNVLLQLEDKNDDLKRMILQKPDFYVPLFMQSCGHMMPDLHKKKRQQISNRLVAALEKNEVPFSIKIINAILTTKLENDEVFDVNSVLDEVDHKWKLQPDIAFFNCLLWQLAKTGDMSRFVKLRQACLERGIQPDKQSDLAEIYMFERRGISIKSDVLIKRFEARYGSDAKYEALGAACCGAAKGIYIDRLRVLLRKSLNNDPESGTYVLNIPQDSIFNIIWLLTESSQDGMGKQWSSLQQQILDHAVRTRGFFKSLYAESERHINHEYFYSAVVIFQDMYRLRNSLESQNRTQFVNQIFGRLANKMISSKLDPNIITELGNRMVAFFGLEARFYDNVLLAILTNRNSEPMEKFEQFRKFIDLVDPERERIHLILPLIASSPDLISRYKMLYRCSTLGYKKIADLSPYMVNAKLVTPFVEESKEGLFLTTDWQTLQGLADSLKSYGIPLKDIWLLYFNLLKANRLHGLPLALDARNIADWLNDSRDICFLKPDAQLESKKAAMNYQLLRKLVIDDRNVEKVHNFLVYRGFPSDTDFSEITEPLLYLYIETANWGFLQKLIQMLSQYTSKPDNFNATKEEKTQSSDPIENPVKNYHLLHILRRKLDELPIDASFSCLIEYAYELKRLFPTAVADQDSFFDSIQAYRSLFRALTQSAQQGRQFSISSVEQIIELLIVLVRLEIINLHANETLTPYIIGRILSGIGWNAAVETWMKFQTSFHCSNGIIELFRHAIRAENQQGITFVTHKAKMFIPPAKISAFLAATYVRLFRYEDAAQVLSKAETPVDAWNVVPVFRLTNSILTFNQRSISADFPLNFMKLCLEHTNLATDEKALQVCHSDWIRICQRQTLGVYAIKFLDLFEAYGIKLAPSELRLVNDVIKKHNRLVDKWITEPNGILNVAGASTKPHADLSSP